MVKIMRIHASVKAINHFVENEGMLKTSEAIALGIQPRTLYQLVDQGELVRIERGLYRLTSFPPLENDDWVKIAHKVSKGVICLISALEFHGLTTEIAHQIYIALPEGVKSPRLNLPIRYFRFSTQAHQAGIEKAIVDNVKINVYGKAKTVADCFKFRNKIGKDVAIAGLREYLSEGGGLSELLEYARINRVEKVITPYIEAHL